MEGAQCVNVWGSVQRDGVFTGSQELQQFFNSSLKLTTQK